MANIQDVARRAGVSISTVSRVVNGNVRVNPEIARRVQLAIDELHYQPSNAARTLQKNRSQIIGLLLSDIENPFFTTLIKGVEDVAQRNGYSIILCNSDENPARERQYVSVLCSERVAGAIVMPTSENPRIVKLFVENHIPVVTVDRRIAGRQVDAILSDNVLGAREAVTHLLGNGYQRIAFIGGPTSSTTGRERLEGYRQALREASIPLDSSLERFGDFKEESGYRLAHELLALEPAIDALFVANNPMTLGALKTIYERQLRVPDDVALVGFDEMPWATLSSISLTTVTQSVYELGNTAALRLFQRLQAPNEITQQEIVIAPTLRIRGSSRSRTPTITTPSSTS
ncbi:MAG: LacI family DNA-binding transcriptional regulator [Ktedonobacteraceae bacterium]